ncbi:hypothetical protein ACFQNF_19490 [Iodobacter arcticus]|uniref:Uncharacterized protein n=1 Tax=Iodobacter arcticus TaxID=590593 RepID=A0ABW2R2L5_9NEIS
MIEATVQRGAGDVLGKEIIDPLIGSVQAAISRGRAEIDASCSVRKLRLTTTYQACVRIGQLLDVKDSLRGHIARGKVVGIEHIASEGMLLSHLDVEIPA